MRKKFDFEKIEKYWQKKWEKLGIYTPKDMNQVKRPFYNLWMFPYPSAEGLHAGHAFASTGSDIFGRFMRMRGYDVFQPIGYDSFGIHSENFALKQGVHPKKLIAKTTKTYEKQLKSLGHGYDWTRTVNTSEVSYYKWTQWLFAEIFKAGLAYRKKASVNWCPTCKTVLADEQVMTPSQAGKEAKTPEGEKVLREDVLVCERCGTLVSQKELEQWFFRITDYANRLLENLSKIDWPERIKKAQINWIGKKEGVEIFYPIKGSGREIKVWTSRVETNFGATFIAVSPSYAESFLLDLVEKKYKGEISKYIERYNNRKNEPGNNKEKDGVFTGLYAINRLNSEPMPVFVSSFVLSEVGSGALVGVPAHDQRDYEFAVKFKLPIKVVVLPRRHQEFKIENGRLFFKKEGFWQEGAHEGEGILVNSSGFNNLSTAEARLKISDFIIKKGWGRKKDHFHLRDWLISRQRYWGTPIPMIFCEKCLEKGDGFFAKSYGSLLHKDQSDWNWAGWWVEENLPVHLPNIKDFRPQGRGKGPLANHPEFYKVRCPKCGNWAKRETDVMDTFVDSSWYFLRYPSVNSETSQKLAFDPQITKKWLPVDLYFGGAEHSVLHLMYARFITLVLSDLAVIHFQEPFPKFFAHGLVIKDGAKMSKSRGNVVNPDMYIKKFGADTLRLYLMFMGPMDSYLDFRDEGIEGMNRFLKKVWNLFVDYQDLVLVNQEDARILYSKMYQTIKKVTEDIESFDYNTAISAIMEYVNFLKETAVKNKSLGRSGKKTKIRCAEWDKALETLVLLLSPFAPHLTEELWVNFLKRKPSVHLQKWPSFDKDLILEEKVKILVQVNGKLRSVLEVRREVADKEERVVKLARLDPKVSKWISKAKVKRIIFLPGRLVNFVN